MRLKLGQFVWVMVGTLFLIGPLFAHPSREESKADNTPTYNWGYAEEASGLLKQVRSLSAQAFEHADLLETHSRNNQADWRNHAERLGEIKRHINTMGQKLQRLQEIHSMIAPWQQEAVNQVMPKAVALAGHTEEAIAYLNERQTNLWAAPYTDQISAISDHTEEIKNTISAFLDYAKASDRLKGLELQLEITGA